MATVRIFVVEAEAAKAWYFVTAFANYERARLWIADKHRAEGRYQINYRVRDYAPTDSKEPW